MEVALGDMGLNDPRGFVQSEWSEIQDVLIYFFVCIRAILDGHEEETILILLISPQADMKR